MKVLCIDNKYVMMWISVGKWYLVSGEDETSYSVISDKGAPARFDKKLFIKVDEWREKKLNELGI